MDKARKPLLSSCLVLVAVLSALGCQSVSKDIQGPEGLQVDFGQAWSSYAACRDSQDVQEVVKKARVMAALIRPSSTDEFSPDSKRPIPSIKAIFRSNRPRFSADPDLMVLDCWLHAGHLAQRKGQDELAHEMYSSVKRWPATSENSYYLTAAQAGLDSLHLPMRTATLNRKMAGE